MNKVLDWPSKEGRGIVIILVIITLLWGVVPSSGFAVQEPVNILILNSYHQGLQWTDDQTEGILKKLHGSSKQIVYVEYIDWKRYPTDDHLDNLFTNYKTKYADKEIDMLLTTDDIALEYALKHREEIFSNAPIVFSGVLKSSADKLLQGQDRVTGVYESLDSEGTLKLALQLNPQLMNVYIVHDLSESGRASGDDVMKTVQALNSYQGKNLVAYSLSALSIDEITQKVATLEKDSIVLIGSYSIDRDGGIFSPETAARQISESSSVPVYSLYEFLLDSGVIGGSLVSGLLQGEYAGEQALRVLAGEKIADLPIFEEETFVKGLNYNELERFAIPKYLIPKDSIVINKPFSFMDTYRILVYTTSAVFMVLVFLIGVLLANVRSRKRVEKSLRASNEEISAMHEELTATEEELRNHFDELVNHQHQLKKTQELYQLVLDAAIDTIWDWDLISDKRVFASSTLDVLGYYGEEIQRIEHWISLIHPEDLPSFHQNLTEHLTLKTPRYFSDYRIKDKSGAYKWIRSFGKAMFDESGKPYRMVGSHRDVSILKEQELKIEHLAYRDSLTGLPNRAKIQEIIEREIEIAHKNGTKLAILFLDVDNFKMINDSFGHPIGDRLLVTISHCLSQIVENNVVSRLAGDEFLILIRNISDKQEAIQFANKIMAKFEKALSVENQLCYVSASIGISYYPDDGDDYEGLLINADTAMHKAKEIGKRQIVVFDLEMKRAVAEKAEIQNNLRKAIVNNEFILHYQPQVDPFTGRVLGLEALIRWQKDDILIPPNKFISIAEETGLIVPMGDWVLQQACVFLRKMHDMGHRELTMAVNISALQLQEEKFVENVLQVLRKNGLEPSRLELEITETMLIEFLDEKILNVLDSLKENRIKISLDDFGLGYSSLNYIKQLPISTLKVDKSFIDDIHDTQDRKNLTGLIVTLAHQLGLKVVAEGVERPEQKEYLMRYKCDAIQGYLTSKPLPEEQVIDLLKDHL
ncbi:ABC transporter substrate binding protein [Desulfitobacterium sp. THU1]|uniref:ABC transporter substrate binding protein n=1 Tax=Desulfitobacterium sp. THU1 TaxID=3138072 RepID=UPI00311FF441